MASAGRSGVEAVSVLNSKPVSAPPLSGFLRLERNAIHFPSGDQRGLSSAPALTMKRRAGALPSAGTDQMVECSGEKAETGKSQGDYADPRCIGRRASVGKRLLWRFCSGDSTFGGYLPWLMRESLGIVVLAIWSHNAQPTDRRRLYPDGVIALSHDASLAS